MPSQASFDTALAAHLDATLDRPDWARLVVWRALGDDPGDPDPEGDAAQRQRLRRGIGVVSEPVSRTESSPTQ